MLGRTDERKRDNVELNVALKPTCLDRTGWIPADRAVTCGCCGVAKVDAEGGATGGRALNQQ